MYNNEANPEHSQCKKCMAWEKCRTPCVPGIRVGRFPIDVLFIGEAPGALEDERGSPFVGRSGEKVLRPLLKKLMKGKSYIITNSVRCRPPNNKLDGRKEADLCKTFLDEEISLHFPKGIFTLGKVALESVTGLQGKIKDLHGKRQDWIGKSKKYNPIVIPSVHPAYTNRNSEAIKWLEDDLKLLLRLIGD